MKTWRHRLDFEGKHLRSLIAGEETKENQAAIVKYLRICCEKIMKKMKEEDYGYREVEELYLLLDGDEELILGNEDMDDYGFESRTELVNDRLAQFYDACDYADCWIGL
jgi:hypothetical protein